MQVALVFLHGVGAQPDGLEWLTGLNVGLSVAGYPTMGSDAVVAPHYGSVLGLDRLPTIPEPPRTGSAREREHFHRGDYEINQASLRRLLSVDGRQPFRNIGIDPSLAMHIAMHVSDLNQARRYINNERMRYTITSLVLGRLPSSECELVVIGHSLGSLVAIDLLQHLPKHLTVRRLITIGSPAGLRGMHKGSTRLSEDFPYGRVKSWLNVLSAGDPVPAGRGVAEHFPAAQDLLINLGPLRHAAFEYLGSSEVSRAVGEAMFGSLHPDPDPLVTTVDVPPSVAEMVAIFSLAYAHHVLAHLRQEEPKIAPRYGAALKVVQAAVCGRLTSLANDDGRPTSRAIQELSNGKQPATPKMWSSDVDQALQLLILGASNNLVEPYSIDDEEGQTKVLERVAIDLGLSTSYGRAARHGLEKARGAVTPNRTWKIVLLSAAGLALLATGPIGLTAAAGGGLAGGAAVTSALAAFGPGGMVGGMMLAGAAASTGAAATTAAIALASAPTAVVELQVVRRMAHAYARKELKMPLELDDWSFLSGLQSQIAADLQVHKGFSDEDAPIVKELGRKQRLLEKALEWMTENDLGPTVLFNN